MLEFAVTYWQILLDGEEPDSLLFIDPNERNLVAEVSLPVRII